MRRVLCVVLMGASLSLPSELTAPSHAAQLADPYTRAAASGEKVEVLEERTEMSTTYANPDGTTTADLSPTPTRVREGAGWKPVDLDLKFADNGTVVPKAAPGDAEFSAGGSAKPLIATRFGEVRASVSWPSALPRPTLDANVATYANVFTGVDLKVSMTDAGPAHVLVIKDRAAAQNKDLGSLKLPYEVENGSLDEDTSGSLTIKDRAGQRIGDLPEATMWDSSGTAVDESGAAVVDDSAEAVQQRTDGPIEGDDVDRVETSAADGLLALEPPTDALAGEDTAYPVYVDPVISPSRQYWAMLFKQHPNSKFHKWTDKNGQGVGYQTRDGVSTKRLLWRYKLPASMAHSHVYSAKFSAKLVYSWSCTASTVRLYRVAGGIDSSTTWAHQPSWKYHLDDRKVAAGRSGCSPAGKEIDFNATQGARDNAASGAGYLTLGLKALRETQTVSWKRFLHKAILKVTYSRPPSKPTALKAITDGQAQTCSASKTLHLQMAPDFHASTSDPDAGDQTRMVWELWKGRPGNATKLSGAWGGWKSDYKSPKSVFKTQNHNYYPRVNGKPEDGPYFWTATAQDDSAPGHATGLKSPASVQCKFEIDRFRPFQPIVSVADEVDWDSPDPVTVTVRPGPDPKDPDKKADVTRYQWGLNTTSPSAKVTAQADGSATFQITASMRSRSGLNRLTVRAYDAANNASDLNDDVEFEVRKFDAAAWSQWTFDEGAGETAHPSGEGSDLPIPSPMQWVLRGLYRDSDDTERSDSKVSVSGDVTTSTTTTVDPSDSFTLSAWVDPVDGAATRTAVSLERAGASVARLRVKRGCSFEGGEGSETSESCFEFSVRDEDSGQWVSAYSREEIASGESGLQHVVGTYEASTETLTIRTIGYESSDPDENAYVGESTASVPGGGPAVIRVSGAGSGSAVSEQWSGFFDHIDVARGAADASQVWNLHQAFTTRQIAEGEGEGDE